MTKFTRNNETYQMRNFETTEVELNGAISYVTTFELVAETGMTKRFRFAHADANENFDEFDGFVKVDEPAAKIKYAIAQNLSTAQVFASASKLNKNCNQILGAVTIEYKRGENGEIRAARALDTFLKRQATKAAQKSRTSLNEFRAQLNINVYEELHSRGLIELWRECPPFQVYLNF